MGLEKRIEKLEREMSLMNPSGERETVYFKIGKGYYEPTPEELEEIREYDVAHPDKGSIRFRALSFREKDRAPVQTDAH